MNDNYLLYQKLIDQYKKHKKPKIMKLNDPLIDESNNI